LDPLLKENIPPTYLGGGGRFSGREARPLISSEDVEGGVADLLMHEDDLEALWIQDCSGEFG